ncbi:MAG: pilus assembly protein [Rhodobacteraceae bacterium]|nr:pilus assembly protein [Paracoccaceae bacterium]
MSKLTALLKKARKNIRKNTRGATMVEFAFAAPIILFMTFGFFEFALVLFTQGVLHYSAEQATRYAMVNFDVGNLEDDYITEVKQGIKGAAIDSFVLIDEAKIANFDVSVVVDPSDQTKTVNVTIDYNYSMIMPLMPGSSFIMTGSSKSFLVQ